jgi:hypothetical protein
MSQPDKDIDRWSLHHFIEVAAHLKLLKLDTCSAAPGSLRRIGRAVIQFDVLRVLAGQARRQCFVLGIDDVASDTRCLLRNPDTLCRSIAAKIGSGPLRASAGAASAGAVAMPARTARRLVVFDCMVTVQWFGTPWRAAGIAAMW